MATAEYYETLGVSKTASQDEIKRAFRKLAVKHHPDKNPGNKQAEERFKKANEAYAVLSDPEKRKQYDTFGAEGFHQRFSQEDIFRGFDVNDLFREMGFGTGGDFARIFGGDFGRQGRRDSQRARGFDFGGGGPGGGFAQASIPGQDLEMELEVTLEEVAAGVERRISYQGAGRPETLSVKIPKGIEDGKRLRLGGKGAPSPYGGAPGDLYIRVVAQEHPVFKREGRDLVVEREISFSEAVLGTEIRVDTVDGKTLNVKIPLGTQGQSRIRVKGHGLPSMKGDDRGNLFVKVNIRVPKKLSRRQKELIQQLRDAGL
jgi:curved DNA-binding protein